MHTLSPEAILSLHHRHALENASARRVAPPSRRPSPLSLLENLAASFRGQISVLPATSAPVTNCCA